MRDFMPSRTIFGVRGWYRTWGGYCVFFRRRWWMRFLFCWFIPCCCVWNFRGWWDCLSFASISSFYYNDPSEIQIQTPKIHPFNIIILNFGLSFMRKWDDYKWNDHLIPNTFSHKLTKPFSSTLSGMPAASTCSHWNSLFAKVLSASLHRSLSMKPYLFRSNSVKMLTISSLLKIPVLKPKWAFFYLVFVWALIFRSKIHWCFEAVRSRDRNRGLTWVRWCDACAGIRRLSVWGRCRWPSISCIIIILTICMHGVDKNIMKINVLMHFLDRFSWGMPIRPTFSDGLSTNLDSFNFSIAVYSLCLSISRNCCLGSIWNCCCRYRQIFSNLKLYSAQFLCLIDRFSLFRWCQIHLIFNLIDEVLFKEILGFGGLLKNCALYFSWGFQVSCEYCQINYCFGDVAILFGVLEAVVLFLENSEPA